MRANLFAVAGNVYFCSFRERNAGQLTSGDAETIARDIELAVAALNRSARDLAAAKVNLLEEADRNAAELIELVDVLDGIALQSNVLAVEWERTCRVGPNGEDVRRLLQGGAVVAADVHTWVREALVHTRSASRVLRDISGRLRTIGQMVTETIDGTAQ